MSITVHINGNNLGRVFEGIGGVTSNGMTKLLREYPVNQRDDIIDLLFRPKFGASFHLLKVEIGSDANGTCGTEPSHMRSESDFDITRGVGLWLAQEAKKRNPKLLLDAIRWGTPAWITDDKKKYLFYKNFLQGAKNSFHLNFDFLAPDENEGSYSRNWVVNTLRPGLNADGFAQVKLTGADSTTDWNIASMVTGDNGLKNALYAINAHYKQDSPDNAKNCGLPIFDSEDIAAFRHKFSSSLDMAYKMIRSYASGRMVQYQMHPVIEAIYDNAPYTYKSLLAAAHPWTGHYSVEPSLWVTAQFTQFMQPGWNYIDSGCSSGSERSYLTLKDTQTGDFSIIVLNRGASDAEYTFQLSNLPANILHLWKTTEQEQFVQSRDLTVTGGAVNVTVPAYSICTLTTTTGQQKGQPAHAIPEATSFPLPYTDNFQSYELGKQPLYTIDQSGAYEIHEGGRNGAKCLKQIITQSIKPVDWERRATPSPYTILGGQELKNYRAGFDFYLEAVAEPNYEGYVMLGVRCNHSPMANVPPECYNLRIFTDGRWQLRRAALVLESGVLTGVTQETWHSIELSVCDDMIYVYYDGALFISWQDQELPSGNVIIGSGYNIVRYENFYIKPFDNVSSVECIRYQELDSRIQYLGGWSESGNNANNYTRSLLITNHQGDSMEFAFNGTAVTVLGMIDVNCGKADVYLDDVYQSTFDAYSDTAKYRKGLFSAYQLTAGDHKLRIVVTNQKNTDSTGYYINIDAVEVTGGTGLTELVHTPVSTDVRTDVILYQENFSSFTPGNKPDGWIVQEDTGTSCRVAVLDHNNCLELEDQSTSGLCYAVKSFTGTNDRIKIAYRYRTSATGKWFRLYAMDGNTSVVEIYDSNVNGLCYRNQSASDIKISDITVNNWYDIVLDIDIAANLFAVYVNGDLKRSGCTFRRTGAKINGIRLESGTGFAGQAWYGDFKLEIGTLLEDSFQSQNDGDTPIGWTVTVPNNSSCTIASSPSATDKSMRLYDNNTTQQITVTKPFARQTDIVILHYRFYDSACGTWSRMLLTDGSTTAIGLYNSDLDGLCYKNNKNKYVKLMDIQPKIWYDVTVAADVAKKRFDVYINEQRIAVGCEFNNVVNGINSLTFASGASYTGTTYFNSISLKQGSKP